LISKKQIYPKTKEGYQKQLFIK